jgi:RNA polymerase sigma-70 factor (ECF subfamily)
LYRTRSTIAEKDLVALLKSKDKRGFDLLYENYSKVLYGIVLKIVHSEDLAEDVLQDAFVKIWNKIDAYEASKGTLFTWILNVARNTAIDKIRSQNYKNSAKVQPLDNHVSMLDSQSYAQTQIEHIGQDTLVSNLKPEQRILIDYIYFRGYTQAEVAEALNIPLGTVKTRVKSAINHLREFFK